MIRRVVGRVRRSTVRRLRPARKVGPRFEVVDRFRPFELIGARFVALRAELGTPDGLVRSDYSPPAPFVTVDVSDESGIGAVSVGLAAENGDHLLAVHADGEVGLELRTGGFTTVLATRRVRGRVRRMALVLLSNEPTVLVDTGHGWHPVATDRHRVAHRIDFRVPATLARFTAAWSSGGGTADTALVRAGLFGMAGLRDLHLVQHADGTPYLQDGRMYFTATCAGLGFFPQAHWAVFAYGPARLSTGGDSRGGDGVVAIVDGHGLHEGLDEPWVLEQTAHLFSRRDDLILGDHAGQLVRDGDRWLVATSSWGDFAPHRGVHVRHTTSTEDLLRGVHVLETERTPLPSTVSTWDPGMTRIDGRWHVSYVESPSQQPFDFHPALAVGPFIAEAADAFAWHEGLAPVGAATGLHQCEGPVLGQPDGPGTDWRLLASDGHARTYPVFDLAMNRVGELDAPYGSNIPHPQVVEMPDGGRTIVTFDGTQYAKHALGYGTHGDVVVMRATQD